VAEHSNMSRKRNFSTQKKKKKILRGRRISADTHAHTNSYLTRIPTLNTDTYASTPEPAQRYGRFCRISVLFIFHLANRSREERSESPVVCVYSRVNRSFST